MAKSKSNELLPGTLDMLVLKTLSHGALHGYAIAQRLKQVTDEFLDVEEGSLYPALQRLELNGWIEGQWSVTPSKRRARFYHLTKAGRKRLAEETERYQMAIAAIAKVLAT